MSIIDELTRQAGRIAGDVQSSIRRARVEGERRLLQRQHRAALEELGERVYELVKAGTMPEDGISAEVAAVEAKLVEIEAKAAEIDDEDVEDGQDSAPAGDGAETPDATPTAPATPPPADAAATAFPMVEDPPSPAAPHGPGAGWEAADRFFSKD